MNNDEQLLEISRNLVINKKLETIDKTPKTTEMIVLWTVENFPQGLVMMASGGIKSHLGIHLINRLIPNIPTIFINTGHMVKETPLYIEELRALYNLNLHIYHPLLTKEQIVEKHGEKLWDTDSGLYAEITKKEPMRRAYKELNVQAVISCILGDETEHRANLPIVQLRRDGTYKIHPVHFWTQEMVDHYFFMHDLEPHPLKALGYESVGDEHSTKPGPGRTGRSLGVKSECGLHL